MLQWFYCEKPHRNSLGVVFLKNKNSFVFKHIPLVLLILSVADILLLLFFVFNGGVVLGFSVFAVTALLFTLTLGFLFYYNDIVRKSSNRINQMGHIARDISEGNLGADLSPYRGDDEFSELIGGFESIINTLSMLKLDIDGIIDAMVNGTSVSSDITHYPGGWSDYLKRLQEMLEIYIEGEKKSNLKNRFLVNMSHEIRTPLNAIIGLSHLALMREQLGENYATYRKINVSAKNLLTIINDILDFSKIEAENLEIAESDFALEDIIANALMVSSERIESKKIEMLLHIDSTVPYFLYGDKTRLWQILKNILDNSAKYTNVGRIVLDVSLQDRVSVNEKEDNVNLTFKISDTGIGMSDDQIKRIYIPFEQFQNKGHNQNMGTGLGMTITKRLVDLLGGTIDVTSKPNIGTTTVISLPFNTVKGSETMKEAVTKYNCASKRILIAEDDKYATEIMTGLLELVDIIPTCVPSGMRAIEAARQKSVEGEPFDMIILDYMLGDINGIDVANSIRDCTKGRTKLLMVSAYTKQLLEDDIKTAGFSEVIEKPFVPSSFLQKLCDTLFPGTEIHPEEYFTFKGSKVIVCEDNEFNQEVITGMLEVYEVDYDIAKNGEECLSLLKSQDYDLIFMDILMPVMDGYQTTEIIRSSGAEYSDIPIIAMTANVMDAEVEKCRKVGMNDHLGKPVDMAQVYDQICLYLKNSGKNESKKDNNAAVNAAQTEESVINEGIPGIDVSQGIARYGGKSKKYFDSLLKFSLEIPQDFEEYGTFSSAENHQKSVSYIHMLKGVSGNLSITDMYQSSTTLEKALKECTLSQPLYDSWINICKKVKSDVLSRLSLNSDSDNLPAGSDEDLHQLMLALTDALDSSSSTDVELVINKLREKQWSKNNSLLKELYDAANQYEYEQSLVFANEIIKNTGELL